MLCEFAHHIEDGIELLEERSARSHSGLECFEYLCLNADEHGDVQVDLRWKVVVNRRSGDSGAEGDVAIGRALVTTRRERAASFVENALASLGRVTLSGPSEAPLHGSHPR